MTLRWKIDSEEQIFEVVCDGLVEGAEVDQMLDVLVASRALGYRKLFDGTRGETRMGPLEVLKVGVRIRALHAGYRVLGPLAVVAPDDRYPVLARVLGILAVPPRPMKVFSDVRRARAWLNSRALQRWHN